MGAIREALQFIATRSRSYKLAFNTPDGRAVLVDLAKFCRANAPTFDADPRIHALAEGRREVWLRIQQQLRLTDEELYGIYTGRQFDPQQMDKEDRT